MKQVFTNTVMLPLALTERLFSFIPQAPEGEAQPMTEVDLFISTQRIKVLNADSQVFCSYIPSNGNISTTSANRSKVQNEQKSVLILRY